jgi:predicted DsbA family dithiol-disulfide isomerase
VAALERRHVKGDATEEEESVAGIEDLKRALRCRGAVLLSLAALWGLALAGCAPEDRGPATVLATVAGEPVTMAAVDSLAGEDLARLDYASRVQRYRLLRAAVDRIVRDRLLEAEARERGVTLEALIAAETDENIEVTPGQVAQFYGRNFALSGQSLEDLRPRIERYLRDLERQRLLDEMGKALAESADVILLLEPVRADLDNSGAPALGPADAPATLVEFSDFQCPYCRRFVVTVSQLITKYGDDLRVVFRQYPLVEHADAFKAAEASLCAHDQGRFWDLHDLMFAEPDSLDVESLKEKASRIGLDRPAFDACLDSGRMAERVERDVRAGDRLGVSGTPFVLVNGIELPSGAVPFEVAAALIDEELARVKR